MKYAEITRKHNFLRICRKKLFTNFKKFFLTQKLAKTSDFLRESGDVLSLFLCLLLCPLLSFSNCCQSLLIDDFDV